MNGLRDEIDRKYKSQNRLHAVLLEVTHRCHCDCTHCLLVKTPAGELTLEEITDLLRQLRAEGVFNLGITGGEPFLRKDLPQILQLARADRFFVSLLTTATLIGPAEVRLLQQTGVNALEVSLLGAEPSTHDSIMQHPGAFERMIEGVTRLRDAGLNVRLKTTVMKPNWKELPAMARLARKLDVGFSASVSIAPRTDGDLTPQQLALNEKEVAQIDPALIDGGPIPDEDYTAGAILTCRAGRTVAGISPRGDVFPCILFRRKVGNIRERSMQSIWHSETDPFLDELRGVRDDEVAECFACALRRSCRRCPGVAYSETGQLRVASPSACVGAKGIVRAKTNGQPDRAYRETRRAPDPGAL